MTDIGFLRRLVEIETRLLVLEEKAAAKPETVPPAVGDPLAAMEAAWVAWQCDDTARVEGHGYDMARHWPAVRSLIERLRARIAELDSLCSHQQKQIDTPREDSGRRVEAELDRLRKRDAEPATGPGGKYPCAFCGKKHPWGPCGTPKEPPC